MGTLETLGLALGASFASGINLYATVAVLGLLDRLGVVDLPPSLEALAHPGVLTLAVVLFAVEFFADKVPYVDNVWDAVHTFIRPPAAALIGWGMFGDVSEPWRAAAALLAGSVALTAHGAKASTRLAANASPEPFSNWLLSTAEDAFTAFLVWLAAAHPILTLVVVAVLLAVSIWLVVTLFGLLRAGFERILGRPASRPAAP
jgi:hypothetical protein